MEQQMKMAKQLMDQQRAMFEGILNNMTTFWDQTERMLGAFMDQAVWVPAQGKTALREWISGNKKGCESFKNAATEGFNWMESVMTGNSKRSEDA